MQQKLWRMCCIIHTLTDIEAMIEWLLHIAPLRPKLYVGYTFTNRMQRIGDRDALKSLDLTLALAFPLSRGTVNTRVGLGNI